MFELSDYLVGIYKVTDCTNSVTIQNDPPKFHSATQQQSQSFFDPNSSLKSDSGLDQTKTEKLESEKSPTQSDSQKENVPEPAQAASIPQQPMEVSVEAN